METEADRKPQAVSIHSEVPVQKEASAEPARRMAGAVHMRVTGVVMRNLRLNRFFLRHLESASVSTLAFSRMMVS